MLPLVTHYEIPVITLCGSSSKIWLLSNMQQILVQSKTETHTIHNQLSKHPKEHLHVTKFNFALHLNCFKGKIILQSLLKYVWRLRGFPLSQVDSVHVLTTYQIPLECGTGNHTVVQSKQGAHGLPHINASLSTYQSRHGMVALWFFCPL